MYEQLSAAGYNGNKTRNSKRSITGNFKGAPTLDEVVSLEGTYYSELQLYMYRLMVRQLAIANETESMSAIAKRIGSSRVFFSRLLNIHRVPSVEYSMNVLERLGCPFRISETETSVSMGVHSDDVHNPSNSKPDKMGNRFDYAGFTEKLREAKILKLKIGKSSRRKAVKY